MVPNDSGSAAPPAAKAAGFSDVVICPSCGHAARGGHYFDCAECGYTCTYLPSVWELLSGDVDTSDDWNDVNLGAYLRRCVAVVMLHADEINPSQARSFGFVLMHKHPRAATRLLAETAETMKQLG